ncbi:MAG TPA: WecB/TagA/CpsF family glycosyltransferase [Solirubrobacteraceae bacterium]|jgi:N-acetylglucosaminyldiphosphoundecaprenol N-acetyl-beta-D-mannosaminyltransferase|nr:WecB/TagA/CpsF family glycosyltransferase [Solirubrobacteraceae bacterium]
MIEESTAPSQLPRAEVLGAPLAISDYSGVLAWMESAISQGRREWVSAAAVNLVMSAVDRPEVRAALDSADLLVPDGQPLVWALHALGHRSATRIYGPELMARFCARAATKGIPIYLYGGRNPSRLALLGKRLRERFPGLPIAGGFSPPFAPMSEQERQQIAAQIDASGAQVIWVGTGQPKQELWMAQMRPLLAAPLLVGVGAAFDFHAGLLAQAPAWMQQRGLEWLFRLSREPRRLWRRYASQNPRFLAGFARQYAGRRR